jgi:hypothetical protein
MIRLAVAQVASCDCVTKSHEPEHHNERCRYRVMHDAAAEIDYLREKLMSWVGAYEQSKPRPSSMKSIYDRTCEILTP